MAAQATRSTNKLPLVAGESTESPLLPSFRGDTSNGTEATVPYSTAMESAATGGSAMDDCRSKAAFGKCLQQIAKQHCTKQYSVARGKRIYDCKKLLPEDCTDPFKMNAFHEQYSKSESELAVIGEKMPSKSYLMRPGAITVDESVANSKLRVNGEKMVFNEDLYNLVEPAFLEAKEENPTSSLNKIIEKTKEKFGANGPDEYRNYHLRAANLDYLDPSVPEPNDVALGVPHGGVLENVILENVVPRPQLDLPRPETALATGRGAQFPNSTAPFGSLSLPDTMSTDQMTAFGAGIARGITSNLGSVAGAQPGVVNFNMPIGGSGINFGSQTINNNSNNSGNGGTNGNGTNGNGTNSSPLASRSQVSELLQRVDELGNTISKQPQETAAAVTKTVVHTVQKAFNKRSLSPGAKGMNLDDALKTHDPLVFDPQSVTDDKETWDSHEEEREAAFERHRKLQEILDSGYEPPQQVKLALEEMKCMNLFQILDAMQILVKPGVRMEPLIIRSGGCSRVYYYDSDLPEACTAQLHGDELTIWYENADLVPLYFSGCGYTHSFDVEAVVEREGPDGCTEKLVVTFGVLSSNDYGAAGTIRLLIEVFSRTKGVTAYSFESHSSEGRPHFKGDFTFASKIDEALGKAKNTTTQQLSVGKFRFTKKLYNALKKFQHLRVKFRDCVFNEDGSEIPEEVEVFNDGQVRENDIGDTHESPSPDGKPRARPETPELLFPTTTVETPAASPKPTTASSTTLDASDAAESPTFGPLKAAKALTMPAADAMHSCWAVHHENKKKCEGCNAMTPLEYTKCPCCEKPFDDGKAGIHTDNSASPIFPGSVNQNGFTFSTLPGGIAGNGFFFPDANTNMNQTSSFQSLEASATPVATTGFLIDTLPPVDRDRNVGKMSRRAARDNGSNNMASLDESENGDRLRHEGTVPSSVEEEMVLTVLAIDSNENGERFLNEENVPTQADATQADKDMRNKEKPTDTEEPTRSETLDEGGQQAGQTISDAPHQPSALHVQTQRQQEGNLQETAGLRRSGRARTPRSFFNPC